MATSGSSRQASPLLADVDRQPVPAVPTAGARPGPSGGRLGPRVRALAAVPKARTIVSNATSLAGTFAVTAGLGVVYWWVAARSFSPSAVGFGSAAVSGMTLVATLASLGLGTFAMGEAPRRERPAALIFAALLASTALGIVGAGAYLLVVPFLSGELAPLREDLTIAAIFVLGCASISLGMVADQALIGALRGSLQLWRNGVFGVVKLLLLVGVALAFAGGGGGVVLTTWVIGGVVSFAVMAGPFAGWATGFASLPRRGVDDGGRRALFGEVAGSLMGHQALNLALRVPYLALPIVVVGLVSTSANASFYIAWMMTTVAFVLPSSLATVLYAVSSDGPAILGQRMRMTLALSTAITIVACGVLIVSADLVMSIFGASYARDGDTALRLLALAGVPSIVKNHFVVVSRVSGQIRRALPFVWVGGGLEFGFAVVGAHLGGLDGLCAGYLVALFVEAVLMTPTVARAVRYRDASPPETAANSSS